jgi:heme/copper-type cytochrome/quinol oxidase subunit 2
LSILVTILGWFFLPVISAVIGLILAYRARKQARTTYGRSGSERLARTAIIIGWVGIGIGLVPLILTLAVAGFSWGFTLCNGPIEAWSY